MKLWIAYVLGCFVVSLFTLKLRAEWRTRILIVMIIFVMIGYYFFNQI